MGCGIPAGANKPSQEPDSAPLGTAFVIDHHRLAPKLGQLLTLMVQDGRETDGLKTLRQWQRLHKERW